MALDIAACRTATLARYPGSKAVTPTRRAGAPHPDPPAAAILLVGGDALANQPGLMDRLSEDERALVLRHATQRSLISRP